MPLTSYMIWRRRWLFLQEPYKAIFDPIEYPLHDRVKRVSRCGHIVFGNRWKPYLSTSLAGECVGLREFEPGRWLVHFLDCCLGEIRESERRFVPSLDGIEPLLENKKV